MSDNGGPESPNGHELCVYYELLRSLEILTVMSAFTFETSAMLDTLSMDVAVAMLVTSSLSVRARR